MNHFAQYKDILSVGHWIYEGNHIKIQGTNEDPLFNCLDVIHVLGDKKSNHNKFYKVNKTNPLFIVGVTNSHPSESTLINPQGSESVSTITQDSSIVVNQHSSCQNYFTE
jgi:hypothetical protein